VNAPAENDHTRTLARTLVLGASSLVGGYIVEHLVRRGERPLALSRLVRTAAEVEWLDGDLNEANALKLPPFETLYCKTDAVLLAKSLPHLFNPALKRIVVFSSTSVLTKIDSKVVAEQEMSRSLAAAEQEIIGACEQNNVGWTILRPTLIYDEGRDINITPLSRLIRRLGFMLLVGGAPGLRQPVHAEDLAIGAIAAASSAVTMNKFYSLPGGETISYREMVGRIFDGLRKPRRTVPVPVWLWRFIFFLAKPLFPDANVAMGLRMTKDMVFDSTPAAQDFGWKPRTFHPVFE
jgi:nucleoside-diphosphate-sugar epimerase